MSAEQTTTVLAVCALIVSVVVAVINGRSSIAAMRTQGENNIKIAHADDDTNAGKLALEIATRTDRRLDILEEWRDETVNSWWPRHEARDRAIERELQKLDPSTMIPEALPLPPLRTRPLPEK